MKTPVQWKAQIGRSCECATASAWQTVRPPAHWLVEVQQEPNVPPAVGPLHMLDEGTGLVSDPATLQSQVEAHEKGRDSLAKSVQRGQSLHRRGGTVKRSHATHGMILVML